MTAAEKKAARDAQRRKEKKQKQKEKKKLQQLNGEGRGATPTPGGEKKDSEMKDHTTSSAEDSTDQVIRFS